jgi:HAD superfamily hydrolase (TIGR01548 family)
LDDDTITTGAVVFDLDGVLVDVSGSYRRAIKETINILHDASVSDEMIQRLKDAGGFNNDWDVTYALSLAFMTDDTVDGFDREEWFREIESGSGGLNSARASIEDQVSQTEFDHLIEQWDRSAIRAIFQELYLGSELYEKIEDKPAQRSESGYIHDEEVLLSETVRNTIREEYPVGILTGRPRQEAEIALERVGLDLNDDQLCAMEDWEESKPDPSGLIRFSELFSVESLVFVGDTLDDVRTAVAASRDDSSCDYYGIGVLSGGLSGTDGRKKFKEAGAAEILQTVNQLPGVITK